MTLGQRRKRDIRTQNAMFSKGTVAELSAQEITEMSRDELMAVIGTVQVPSSARLEYQDRKTLERLTYLARRCCRNQGY